MKLLLVIVCIKAVFTADGQDFPKEPGEAHLFPYGNEDQNKVEGSQNLPNRQLGVNLTLTKSSDKAIEYHQLKNYDMEMLLGRSRWCRKRGGRCSRRKFVCDKDGYQESPLGRPYCTGKNRRCCYPVTTSPTPSTTLLPTTTSAGCRQGDGFFKIAHQCFKFLDDSGRSYDAGKTKCQELGLIFAQPKFPVPLRNFLVAKYGAGNKWPRLGARGTGSVMKWDHDGTTLSSNNTAWYSGHPSDRTSTDYCLILLIGQSFITNQPTKPFYSESSCTNAVYYALCELV